MSYIPITSDEKRSLFTCFTQMLEFISGGSGSNYTYRFPRDDFSTVSPKERCEVMNTAYLLTQMANRCNSTYQFKIFEGFTDDGTIIFSSTLRKDLLDGVFYTVNDILLTLL